MDQSLPTIPRHGPYLPTVPETDLASCCAGSIENCPGNYSRGKRILLSTKADRDGMLAGQDECQPQDGCQRVRISKNFPKSEQASSSHNGAGIISDFFFQLVVITWSELTSVCLNSLLGALSCSIVLQK